MNIKQAPRPPDSDDVTSGWPARPRLGQSVSRLEDDEFYDANKRTDWNGGLKTSTSAGTCWNSCRSVG